MFLSYLVGAIVLNFEVSLLVVWVQRFFGFLNALRTWSIYWHSHSSVCLSSQEFARRGNELVSRRLRNLGVNLLCYRADTEKKNVWVISAFDDWRTRKLLSGFCYPSWPSNTVYGQSCSATRGRKNKINKMLVSQRHRQREYAVVISWNVVLSWVVIRCARKPPHKGAIERWIYSCLNRLCWAIEWWKVVTTLRMLRFKLISNMSSSNNQIIVERIHSRRWTRQILFWLITNDYSINYSSYLYWLDFFLYKNTKPNFFFV